ncbi:hypothetical protein ACFVY4_26735 [Streptomyces sp. NPDC058299]|uniref:hypothetical protein n=1 Tax=Streptomyces sp. NPDC058299 TaxID=3346435 RepID=UPI0036E269E7
MSYDTRLTVTVNTGAADGPVTLTVVDVGNYTSSVAPLWEKALGFPLHDLNGRTAGDVVAELNAAVAKLERDPAGYRAMVPPGSWGSPEGAAQYLHRIRVHCILHPKTTIEVD